MKQINSHLIMQDHSRHAEPADSRIIMQDRSRDAEQADSRAPVVSAAVLTPSSTEESNIPGLREQILANGHYKFPQQDLHVIVFWNDDTPSLCGYEADLIGFNEPDGGEQAYLRCKGVHPTVVGALRGLLNVTARFMFAVEE